MINVHDVLVLGSLMNAIRQTGSIALQVVQGSLGFGTTHAYTLAKTARPTMSAFPTKGTNCIATPHWIRECGKLFAMKNTDSHRKVTMAHEAILFATN